MHQEGPLLQFSVEIRGPGGGGGFRVPRNGRSHFEDYRRGGEVC